MSRRQLLTALIGLLLLGTAAVGCTSIDSATGNSGSGPGGRVRLVAFSAAHEAYEKIVDDFVAGRNGAGIRFSKTYGASGEQSRAVEAGLPADIVALALAPDVDRLIEFGKVSKDWRNGPHGGFVTKSVVVFAVREGNPKKIESWDDLLRDDVEVLTPNASTSGGARWNLMAAYGAQLERGKSPAAAERYLADLLANVSVQDKSARESLQTFASGKGDVLLAYENEAITARDKGQELDYVIPDETILIENPIALTAAASPAGKGFFEYLHEQPAQRTFAEHGFRPVLEAAADPQRFPIPRTLFTIRDLGGWNAVMKKFFDPKQGLLTKINRERGATGE